IPPSYLLAFTHVDGVVMSVGAKKLFGVLEDNNLAISDKSTSRIHHATIRRGSDIFTDASTDGDALARNCLSEFRQYISLCRPVPCVRRQWRHGYRSGSGRRGACGLHRDALPRRAFRRLRDGDGNRRAAHGFARRKLQSLTGMDEVTGIDAIPARNVAVIETITPGN